MIIINILKVFLLKISRKSENL